MSKSQAQLPLSRRWPYLFWLGVVFCFFIFPIFLIDVGLDSLLTTRRNLQKQEIFRRLDSNLEQLVQFKNSRNYYHALLKKIFDLATLQKEPDKYLQKALPHLKMRNPGTFKFIVWDQSGNSIDSLTDEKGYRYVVKTLFDVITEVYEDCQANYPGTPENLAAVAKRLNLMRSYLGTFLIPEKLNLPLFRSNLGEIIMASSDSEKSHFWFQAATNLTMLATINSDAIRSTDYLKKLVNGMNKNYQGEIKCGIAELVDDQGVYTGFKHEHGEELLIELGKFQNFSEPHLETAHYLIAIKMLSPFIMGFSFIDKSHNLLEIRRTRSLILLSITGIILFISGIFIYLVFWRRHIISIRLKLALLFVYANGLPLMILGFLGNEYLQQTRRIYLDQAQEQVATLATDFDSKYEIIKDKYATQLNNFVDETIKTIGDRPVTGEDLKKFLPQIMTSRPYDFIVSDKEGRFTEDKTTGNRASAFFANMSRNLLNYVNIKSYTPQELFRDDTGTKESIQAEKFLSEKFLSGKTIVFHRFLLKTGRVSPEQMGPEKREFYWNMLGNYASRNFHNLMVVSWKPEVLQENYIHQNFKNLDTNFGQFKFFAMIENNGMTYPLNESPQREIFDLFRQTFNFKTAFTDSIKIAGKRYAAYGTMGKQLDKVAIVGLIPLDQIESKISSLEARLIIFAVLSLSLTLGIGSLLSSQFMQPVKELEKGVAAIGRQDFRYRLPITSADEFGHLSNVFNNAIGSLEDLQIAQIVQENLFPQEDLKQNNLEIFGRSVAMTRLGGDYYDFFAIDDEMVGVIMGDVAGHGVPAAMLMAMAKASVLLTNHEKIDPSLMLSSLHKVIHRVKSSKIKRMMTCQYFCINSQTGAYSVSNAGHCFPAVISNSGKDVTLVKLIGTPLGITKKPKYENSQLQLNSGDIVLLYTDGIIESQNLAGKELGFDNFVQLLRDSYSENIETYYQNIFNGYQQWAAITDDDITMILMRFNKEQNRT